MLLEFGHARENVEWMCYNCLAQCNGLNRANGFPGDLQEINCC